MKIGILGASGYAGAELVRILLSHPGRFELGLSSVSFEGKTLDEVYPAFRAMAARRDRAELSLVPAEEAMAGAGVVFSCLPHGYAEKAAAACLAAAPAAGAGSGALFIDFSADFRFGGDEETYTAWYGKTYAHPELHAASVYGLPEYWRSAIRTAKIIGNPGCYPTSAQLGLLPALEAGFADPESIIIDAASGVTGAGREPSATTHYPECADSIAPYKIGAHRHQPEIDRYLSIMAGVPVSSVFTPHLAPMNRGIVSTIYFKLARSATLDELRALYLERYADEPFVRVLLSGATATNRGVKFSNYCDISVHLSSNGKTGIVVSAIDNMVKGAAGQAVQNMNIALGLPENAGLEAIPPAF